MQNVDRKMRDTIQKLREEDPQQLYEILSQLGEDELNEILYDWPLWARDNQIYDPINASTITFFCAGRGTGKTRAAAEAVRAARNQAGCKRIALVGPTSADVRDTIILGESGLIAVHPPDDKPEWEPSKRRVVWPDGSQAIAYSAEEPERLRGPNHDFALLDEPASFKSREAFDQVMLTLRIGLSKVFISGTPKPTELVIELYNRKDTDVDLRTGSTFDNKANLSETFINETTKMYSGTSLEKQELYGELLMEAEGALWSRELLRNQTLPESKPIPPLERVAIGIDPAVTTSKYSDRTGLVTAAMGTDGYAYVLRDDTARYKTDGWVNKVLELYDYYSRLAPTSVVVESNQGGDLLLQALHRERPFLPADKTFSTTSKIARAQPIALMYEKGLVYHVKGLTELENEQCAYEGAPRQKSPDHLDAAVFALTQIMPIHKSFAKVSALEI